MDLLKVLTGLARETDFSCFFEGAAGAAAELLGADGAALIMHEDDDVLRYRFFLGLPEDYQQQYANYRFSSSQGTAGEVFRTRRSVYFSDYPSSPNAMPEYVAAGLKSNLVLPVFAGEQTLGVLAVSWFSCSGPPHVDEVSVKVAELLASMIGAAYHRQELEQELLRRAQHDALTGLCNRVLLFDRMMHAFHQADRSERLAAVLVMDIDGFKRVNDRMGHEAGDRLLREVASRIRDVARESDTIARLGGDEFVVLLENVHSLDEVGRIIRRILAALNIQITVNGMSERVGVSIGATVYPFDDN
ncbi:MAG: sensor domain-containing diguanylate cyclase, partial [Gammaproteobacteria bacterium]